MGVEPSFSVVVPLYDKRDYVRRTIESVLAQTLPAIEVIVIDDGSTDGGAATLADLEGPLRIIHQANAGVGAARNRGIAEARGEWVALIDADDLWYDTHLATLAGVVQAFPQVDLVAGGYGRISTGGMVLPLTASPWNGPRRFDFLGDARTDLISASSVAVRRSAFIATKGFGPYPLGEDTEFWVRFAIDHDFAIDERVTALYRAGTGGMMDRDESDKARGGADALPAVFATIDAALATPRHAGRHQALRGYADRIRTLYARSLLYHGRGSAVRGMCAGLHRRSAAARAYVALSFLPGAALRGVARAYSAMKRR